MKKFIIVSLLLLAFSVTSFANNEVVKAPTNDEKVIQHLKDEPSGSIVTDEKIIKQLEEASLKSTKRSSINCHHIGDVTWRKYTYKCDNCGDVYRVIYRKTCDDCGAILDTQITNYNCSCGHH